MNNLIKNELVKIFHKKAIYIVLIITLLFMILNVVLDKIFTNDDYYFDDSKYLEEELQRIDKNDPEEKERYISLLTELRIIELSKKYENNSWQNYIINYKSREIIYNMMKAEGTERYEKTKKEYEDFILRLDTGNWKAFAEEELKELDSQIKEIEKMSDADKKMIGQEIEELKDSKQVVEWRLEKNIAYGNNEINSALEGWKNTRISLRQIAENEKAKELKYDQKYEKQELEGREKIAKYVIEKGIDENEVISYINGQTAIATELDSSLIEVYSSLALFITIAIVIIAGTIVSEEFNKGTIKLLLVKPYKRMKILAAKFITCLIILLIVYVVVAILQLVVGGIFNGFNNYTEKVVIYNFNISSVEEIGLLKYLVLSGVALLPQYILIMTLAFSLSVIFNNSPIAIALPLLGNMVASIINALTLMYEKARFLKYFVTPNWDLSIYLFGKLPKLESISLFFSISICLIYFIIMLVVSAIVFKKREVKNI